MSSGGRNNMENRYTAAVITVSDKGFAGLREDTSGPALVKLLREDGYEVISTSLVPDDMEKIMTELTICADRLSPCLIVTTGGTGFSKRDITPRGHKGRHTARGPRHTRGHAGRIHAHNSPGLPFKGGCGNSGGYSYNQLPRQRKGGPRMPYCGAACPEARHTDTAGLVGGMLFPQRP